MTSRRGEVREGAAAGVAPRGRDRRRRGADRGDVLGGLFERADRRRRQPPQLPRTRGRGEWSRAWPNSLRGLAAANFINDNVEPPPRTTGRAAGSPSRTSSTRGSARMICCTRSRRAAGRQRPIPRARGSARRLSMGEYPHALRRGKSRRRGSAAPGNRRHTVTTGDRHPGRHRSAGESDEPVDPDDVFGKLGQPSPASGSILCYASTVPIAKLLVFDRAEHRSPT